MAVTTSVFPNLNTFSHGPEFCVLFWKLQSTCKTHKRATLTERYPTLCATLESKPDLICSDFVNNSSSVASEDDDILDNFDIKSGKKSQNKTEHSFHHYPLLKATVSYCAMTQHDEHRTTIQ